MLSDDWILPFDEIIDWSAAAVVVPEDSVLLVSYNGSLVLQICMTRSLVRLPERNVF